MTTADPRAHADAMATRLYVTYGSSLRRYAQKLIGEPQRGEDLVQEAMLRTWLHAHRLADSETARRRWLFRVLHNAAIDQLRADRARPVEAQQLLELGPVGGDPGDRIPESIDVSRALRRLQAKHRAVIVAVFYGDRSLAEAACSLGIPYGTAKSRLFYGLRHLRRLLDRTQLPSISRTSGQPAPPPLEPQGEMRERDTPAPRPADADRTGLVQARGHLRNPRPGRLRLR
jgi:RNA polymerase sigma-70 factor, ECF subfamily